jgi:hypothetical protein
MIGASRKDEFMRLIALCCVAFALAIPSLAQAQNMPNVWAPSGQYRGSTERSGSLYGPDGRYLGQIQRPGTAARRGSEGGIGRNTMNGTAHAQRQADRNRAVYGPRGEYLGDVNRNGDFWDPNGIYRGRLR